MSGKLSREEYLWQLEQLLYRIPAEEREEALEYYRSYFEEAGPQQEEQVMRELGRPEDLAKTIWENVMDSGKHDTVQDALAPRSQGPRREPEWGGERREKSMSSSAGGSGRNRLILFLILLLTSPVWGGILLGFIGILIGLIGVLVGVVAVLIFLPVSLIVVGIAGGVVAIVKGIFGILFSPLIAGFAICAGMVLLAVGVLTVLLVYKFLGACLKGIFRLIGTVISTGFRILGGVFRTVSGR